MTKKILFATFIFLLLPLTYAEDDLYDDIGHAELKEDAGLTPDDSLYFIDKILEGLLVRGNPERALEYKEEKIVEAREMLKEGKVEEAKEALNKARDYSQILEKEVSPEIEKRARESGKATKEFLESIKHKLSEWEYAQLQDVVEEHKEREDKIALAAKISSQIKDLCSSLSELDPVEYSRLCRTEDNAPEWQKKLDKELTEEQKKEAKRFGKIMAECFRTSGKECRCDEIPFPEFANTCSVAAPLAVACDIKGDEDACDRLDNLEMPELPDHLQDIMDDLEDAAEERFDIHMPPECVKAGATSKEACSKVMIEAHSPPECRQALLDSGCKEEWECRKICDKIMMEKHAPECVKKGITDHEECKRFMDSFMEEGHMGPKDDFMIDFNCKNIEDPMERLDCFDRASEKTRDYHDNYEDIKRRERECAKDCSAKQGRWDFSDGECKCYFDDDVWDDDGGWHGYDCSLIDCNQGYHCEPDYGCVPDKKDFKPEGPRSRADCNPDEIHMCEGDRCFCTSNPNDGCGAVDCQPGYRCQYGKCFPEDGGCGDCEAKCPGASRTDCINDHCECYYDKKDDGSRKEHSECKDGCHQECGDQRTDCVDDRCVCLGHDEPPKDDWPEPVPMPVFPDEGSGDESGSEESDTGSGDSRDSDSGSDGGSDSGSESDDSGSNEKDYSDSSSDSGSDSGSSDDKDSSDSGSSDSGNDDSGSDSSDSGSDSGSSNDGGGSGDSSSSDSSSDSSDTSSDAPAE